VIKKPSYGKLSKSLLVKELEDTLRGGESVFVTQFSNVSVNALFDLRKKLRAKKTQYLVVKNTLGRRVFGAGAHKALAEHVGGQCGIAVTKEDVSLISKIFMTFSEENAGFKVSAASIDGQVFTNDMVKQLATLPSREELLSKALGSMMSPVQSFVGVLNQLVAGVVNVIDQIRRSKE